MQRQIPYLLHFTRLRNLESIAIHGLRSVAAMQKMPAFTLPPFNDTRRLDRHPDHISLSIGFPNHFLFYKFQKEFAEPWVVLKIATSVLWKLNCQFCVENAASAHVRNQLPGERLGASALERLFNDHLETERNELMLPPWFPTHPQAEVLVKSHVSHIYIESVVFMNDEERVAWLRSVQKRGLWAIEVDRQFFHPRSDYAYWTARSRAQVQPAAENFTNAPTLEG